MRKRLVPFLATVFLIVSALGQGTINFSTRIPGVVDAPVFVQDGVTGAGAYAANAQLFLLQGTAGAQTYIPLFPATTFRSSPPGLAQNYVIPPATPVVVPGIPAGQQATIVLRVWEAGSTFDASTGKGQSGPITITLGGEIPGQPPLVPANLVGLQGFMSGIIPEPSTIALSLFGGAALLCRRRKQSFGINL